MFSDFWANKNPLRPGPEEMICCSAATAAAGSAVAAAWAWIAAAAAGEENDEDKYNPDTGITAKTISTHN